MFIVEVIPIGRGIPAETLSYFSPRAYDRGALVRINVRKHELPAIVVGTQEAFTMKAALRAATFSLRRLKSQDPQGHLSPRIFETAEYLAQYYAASIGSVLYALLPKEIREGGLDLPTEKESDEALPLRADKPVVFQDTEETRFHEYDRMIRESFAQGRSFLIVVPTSASVSLAVERFGAGISEYTVILHGALPLRALKKTYATIGESEHPLLIIATPAYACLARADIGSVILEHERSGSYVGKTRPYLDYRDVLREHALRTGRRFILAGSVVRSEIAYLLRKGEAVHFGEPLHRLELDSALRVISMKPDSDGATAFSLFSPKLLTAIEATLAEKKHVFLFAARRGLSPLVACIDCGHIFRDPNSGAPVALERRQKNGKEERWLISSVSGYKVRAPDLCPECGSWRLRERGIGIQQVYDELNKHVHDCPIILFDHLSAKTEKRATALIDDFYRAKQAVLLGTTLALPRLSKPVSLSAVVSQDSLRAIPSWRQQEEMYAILMALREKTEDAVYVQTRSEDDILDLVRRGQLDDFYTQELALRETYHYPPYTVFVHLAWTEDAGKTKALIEERFTPYGISLYASPHVIEASPLSYGLLRIPRDAWPSESIVEKLRSLPPSVRITLNPDRIV